MTARFCLLRRAPLLFAAGLLSFVLPLLVAPVHAQVPVAPTIKKADIEIRRGADIVQPPSVFYTRLRPSPDSGAVAGDSLGTSDSLGVLRIPRPSDLDAIQYTDRSRGFALNLQHAMIVADGQLVDVRVSNRAFHGPAAASTRDELLVIRPPADDAFDVTVPDGLECTRLEAGSLPDQQSRGRLVDANPCKQVPGVETVVDVAAWIDVSMTNAQSGVRAAAGSTHNARELRGWLRSLAPGGEQVRFIIVATAPAPQRPTRAAVRLDTTILSPTITVEGTFRVNRVSTSGFEWITSVAGLGGPNWSDLAGQNAPRYHSTRLKGDVTTTLRWRATPEQRYELTLFGSTQPSLSDHRVGNHHDVPYGASLAARFGAPQRTGLELRLEGTFEDDPFQRNTLSAGDQRLRVLMGVDHASLRTGRTHWRLSTGPTYFVDRQTIWENRDDSRQLGYSVDGSLNHLLTPSRFSVLLTTQAQVHQSWGYVQETGNNNLSLTGRLSLKPTLTVGSTMIAVGPVIYLSHTASNYAELPTPITENNLQAGLELTSWIRF